MSGIIAGAITQIDVDTKVLPRMQQSFMAVVVRDCTQLQNPPSCGCPQGSDGKTVLGLFDQFPARRKFLRSRSAEAAACVQAVAPLALAFPEVQVTLLVDGRVALRSAGDGSARSAAVAVLGAEADPHLLDVPQTVLADETGLPVQIADNPMQCVALGAGQTLEDRIYRGALQAA